MFIILSKSYYQTSLLSEDAPNACGNAMFRINQLDSFFIPVYETYEDAVKDFPHETITEIK